MKICSADGCNKQISKNAKKCGSCSKKGSIPWNKGIVWEEGSARQLGEIVKRTEENDPKKLKLELAKIRRELEAAQKTIPQAVAQVATKTETVEVPIIPVKEIEALTAELAGFRKDYSEKLERIAQGFEALNGQKTLTQIETSVTKLLSGIKAPVKPVAHFSPSIEKPKQAMPQKKAEIVVTEAIGELSKFQQEILNGVAEWNALGVSAPNPAQLGFIIGKSPRGSYFQNTVSSLKTSGRLHYPLAGCLGLTSLGEQYAVAEAPTSLREYHDRIRDHLTAFETQIFNTLADAYPNAMSRSELAAAIDKSDAGSYFQNTVSGLKTAGVLEYPRSGYLRATDTLFPEGLS